MDADADDDAKGVVGLTLNSSYLHVGDAFTEDDLDVSELGQGLGASAVSAAVASV